MKHRVTLSALALLIAATAAEASDGAIRDVISKQIDAFLVDDFAAAFRFASPAIKDIFVTPERFGAMVRQGYPMVHRPQDIRFLELREVAGRLWQRVLVIDAEGRAHTLDYQMIETPEGWQINAVHLLRAPGVGA